MIEEKLRVLVVDDDRRMTKTLSDILNISGFQVESAHNGEDALTKIAQKNYICVLTDIRMPGMNGVELFRNIHQSKPELPVVLMTAYATDELMERGLEEGVISVLNKPLDINMLLGFFSSLQKERSIVIVDDDPNFCRTLGDILQRRGFNVKEVIDPSEAEAAIDSNYQVMLLDLKLNGLDAVDVLTKIRQIYPDLPVILVTGFHQEMDDVIKTALELDAYTCLYKPINTDELLNTITNAYNQRLSKMLNNVYYQ